MIKVNVFEVKAKLSEYLERAAGGERILICRHSTPVAELGPVEAARTEPRPIGVLPGEQAFEVPPSFFEPLADEELDLWEGMVSTDPLGRAWPSKVAEQRARYGGKAARPRRRRRS